MGVCALIAAAGSGTRMKMGQNKTHVVLGDKPVLIHTLLAFEACETVDEVIVIVGAKEVKFTRELIKTWIGGSSKVKEVIVGGATRQESILCGLRHLGTGCEIVVIHDAARPFVRTSTIRMAIEAARKYGAAIVSVPMRDTIKVAKDGYVAGTLDRDAIRAARTPQAFLRELIEPAYISAAEDGFVATDDSMVIERKGIKVKVLEDKLDNIKITYREDLAVADAYLERPGFRVGIGFDVHRLVPGRHLILGGVNIPCELGLEGHSDADVVLHAIADAILGACALGDIGMLFPDDDPLYEGISSGVILSRVRELIESQGYTVGNVDIAVLAERPKISEFAKEMRRNISGILRITEDHVGIKATTMEGLGFIGSGDGIACFATCSLISGSPACDAGGSAGDSWTSHE